MALPSNNGIFIHEGLNCSPVVVPTAQSIPMSPSDSTTVKTAVDTTLSNIANEYDPTSTYVVGDCVLYQKVLYQCTTAIPTAESWDSTHWAAVKAVDVGSGGGGPTSADQVSYDNTTSGLSATDVQDAIDELAVASDKAKPIAYISFSGTTGPSSWGTTPTVYTNATITDAHGVTILPADVPNYEVVFRFVSNDTSTYQIPCSNITVIGDNSITARGDYAILDLTNTVERIYHIIWSSSDPTSVGCYRNTLNSKTAASGGTDLSLVTTGEKYSWANPTYLLDRSWGTKTYLNYGGAELPISQITWLAGWNGYELRGVNKNQISAYMHLYTTEAKKTYSGTSITFSIDPTVGEGYILLIGEANGGRVLSLMSIHANNISVSNVTNLGSTPVSASYSNKVLTITAPAWSNIQAISNIPIS